MKKATFVLFITLVLINSALAQSGRLHTLSINNFKKLTNFFKYTGKDIPLISGHRGAAVKGYPENCIETFEYVLKHTPAFFEVDPRLTKDSAIVLLHDATLDRTTTGTGKLSDFTLEEVKKLRLKDAYGNVTPFSVPTLDEAIQWSRGKTVLNLDKKDVPPAMIVAKIREHNAEAYVMITVHNAEQAKYYYRENPKTMFSAFVKTKEALEEYEEAGIPWSQAIAYIGPLAKPENKVMYDLLHTRGVMCMLSAAPSYDKLGEKNLRTKAYRQVFRSGADILESDFPVEASEAIKALLVSQSPKSKYFRLK